MALKYYANFPDAYGNHYRVEILDDNYHQESKEMELGGDGVVISRNGKKITEPIFSMGATIQVWCNENFEYANLFATAEQTNQVVIGRNDKVIFRGWVEPNLYEEEYMSPPYLISIPATDGLASLENYYPQGFDETHPNRLVSILRRCLRCTGMNLPINIACGLNHKNQSDNRLFEKTYVELESLRSFKDGAYEYDDAATLLEDLLKPFSCRIYQSNDEWYVERIKDRYPESVNWIKYTSDTDSTVVESHLSVALDSPEFPFVDNAASLQVDAGYGKQTVKADGDKWDTVIANNYEQGVEPVDADLYPFNVPKKLWYRKNNEDEPTSFADEWGMKQGMKLFHYDNMDPDAAVWQTAKITAVTGDEISISFKFGVEPWMFLPTDGVYKFRMQSMIRDLKYNRTFTLKWVKGKNDESRYELATGQYHINEAEFNVSDDWSRGFRNSVDVSITVEVPGLNSDNYFDQISIAFFPLLAKNGKQWTSGPNFIRSTIIGDVEVKVNERVEDDNTFTATINRNQLRKAEDIDIRFWTLPSASNGKKFASNYNYKNGLIGLTYEAIPPITCPAEDQLETSLPERLLIDNFDQYYDPRYLVSGTVQTGALLSPDCHYTVATIPKETDTEEALPGETDSGLPRKKVFLLTGLEAVLKDASYEVNLEEIKSHQIEANIR